MPDDGWTATLDIPCPYCGTRLTHQVDTEPKSTEYYDNEDAIAQSEWGGRFTCHGCERIYIFGLHVEEVPIGADRDE